MLKLGMKQPSQSKYMTDKKEKSIDPLYLIKKGFYGYTPGNEERFGDNFPSIFDVEFDPQEEECYLEFKFDRNQFCVVLSKFTHGGEYAFTIWIQENVGCGFVKIPNNFRSISQYHFELLFEAIRQEKL